MTKLLSLRLVKNLYMVFSTTKNDEVLPISEMAEVAGVVNVVTDLHGL